MRRHGAHLKLLARTILIWLIASFEQLPVSVLGGKMPTCPAPPSKPPSCPSPSASAATPKSTSYIDTVCQTAFETEVTALKREHPAQFQYLQKIQLLFMREYVFTSESSKTCSSGAGVSHEDTNMPFNKCLKNTTPDGSMSHKSTVARPRFLSHRIVRTQHRLFYERFPFSAHCEGESVKQCFEISRGMTDRLRISKDVALEFDLFNALKSAPPDMECIEEFRRAAKSQTCSMTPPTSVTFEMYACATSRKNCSDTETVTRSKIVSLKQGCQEYDDEHHLPRYPDVKNPGSYVVSQAGDVVVFEAFEEESRSCQGKLYWQSCFRLTDNVSQRLPVQIHRNNLYQIQMQVRVGWPAVAYKCRPGTNRALTIPERDWIRSDILGECALHSSGSYIIRCNANRTNVYVEDFTDPHCQKLYNTSLHTTDKCEPRPGGRERFAWRCPQVPIRGRALYEECHPWQPTPHPVSQRNYSSTPTGLAHGDLIRSTVHYSIDGAEFEEQIITSALLMPTLPQPNCLNRSFSPQPAIPRQLLFDPNPTSVLEFARIEYNNGRCLGGYSSAHLYRSYFSYRDTFPEYDSEHSIRLLPAAGGGVRVLARMGREYEIIDPSGREMLYSRTPKIYKLDQFVEAFRPTDCIPIMDEEEEGFPDRQAKRSYRWASTNSNYPHAFKIDSLNQFPWSNAARMGVRQLRCPQTPHLLTDHWHLDRLTRQNYPRFVWRWAERAPEHEEED